ncbi:hypothetical protein D9M72_443470 [compost metagenome]
MNLLAFIALQVPGHCQKRRDADAAGEPDLLLAAAAMVEATIAAFELQPITDRDTIAQRLRVVAERLDREADDTVSLDARDRKRMRLAQARLHDTQESELARLRSHGPSDRSRRDHRRSVMLRHLENFVAAGSEPRQKLGVGIAQDAERGEGIEIYRQKCRAVIGTFDEHLMEGDENEEQADQTVRVAPEMVGNLDLRPRDDFDNAKNK